MPHDSLAVSNLLLDIADNRQIPITTLSLQKILFFAHGTWLARTSAPLLEHSFLAWKFGPVVKVVFDAFKKVPKAGPISIRALRFDLVERLVVQPKANFSRDEVEFLDEIVSIYGPMNPFDLVKLTHASDGPWRSIRDLEEISPGMIIDNSTIHLYFKGLIANQ